MKQLICIICIVLTSLGVAQDFSKLNIISTELAPNVWRIQASGGNIGIIMDGEEVVMIDAQYRGLSERLDSTIQSITSGKKSTYLINTHWHFDHTGGNPYFGPNTTGIGHKNMKKRYADGQEIKFFNATFEPAEASALPETTFDSVYTLTIGKTELEIWHPGRAHTDGDAIIYIKEKNVVHMGDCLFSDMYPYIDLESGGDPYGYLATLKQVYSRIDDKTQLIAGHGPVYNKAELEAYIKMVELIAHRVTLHQDKTKAELIEMDVLSDIDEKWGKSFIHRDQVVGFFYDHLHQNQ